MESFSEMFAPFYKTGDATSQNPVILTNTSVTTLNRGVTSQNPVILTTTSVTTLNRGGDIAESSNPYKHHSDHVK